MEKRPYSKPTVKKIRLEDEEVASMATACKTGDPTTPIVPEADCAPGGLFNPLGNITAVDACIDPITRLPCSAVDMS